MPVNTRPLILRQKEMNDANTQEGSQLVLKRDNSKRCKTKTVPPRQARFRINGASQKPFMLANGANRNGHRTLLDGAEYSEVLIP